MKVIAFRLQGKMAHFRRYYSNSSALSYSVPPRTTVAGIVAGLLGWTRDTYYDVFSLGRCRIALQSAAPIKKQMQKLNLLKVEKPNDLNGSQGVHTQTATELVMPQDIRQGILDYRVWFSHDELDIMAQLEGLLHDGPGYRSLGIALALGAAPHLGWIAFDGIVEGEEVELSEAVPVASVIPLHRIQEIDLETGEGSYRLIREELPLEFDTERRVTERGRADMLINLAGGPVMARVSSAVHLEDGTFITWME
ncbi:MAG TPA: CRISPR-associated protein Cas5 [Alicyclobacillus sp.]|nr:CRISPR-associated protein Cas5 [Alicyclobacillus sp.]